MLFLYCLANTDEVRYGELQLDAGLSVSEDQNL